jgi:hypothetical protein
MLCARPGKHQWAPGVRGDWSEWVWLLEHEDGARNKTRGVWNRRSDLHLKTPAIYHIGDYPVNSCSSMGGTTKGLLPICLEQSRGRRLNGPTGDAKRRIKGGPHLMGHRQEGLFVQVKRHKPKFIARASPERIKGA